WPFRRACPVAILSRPSAHHLFLGQSFPGAIIDFSESSFMRLHDYRKMFADNVCCLYLSFQSPCINDTGIDPLHTETIGKLLGLFTSLSRQWQIGSDTHHCWRLISFKRISMTY